MDPKVVCIRKKSLEEQGYSTLTEWLKNPKHVYIGRNMSFYVPGATKSKWANPFSVKKCGRMGAIQAYQEFILESDLKDSIGELEGCKLGCWCYPEACHGDVLVKLFKDMKKSKKDT